MDRRQFLNISAAGVMAGLTAVASDASSAFANTTHAARHRIAYTLPPSSTPRWAWTIDDGVSSESIATYLQHALRDPQIKYTYFVTSMYPSWKANARDIRELISRGQVQLANHTHTHKDLRTLSNRGIQRQLLDCQHFLQDEFAVTGAPFWRPPYGYFDFRVLAAAADVGYTAPTMWMGVFGTDSSTITASQVLANVNKWVQNGRIVIDHANFPLAARNFDQIMQTIKPKGLQMVTLAEAFPGYMSSDR